MFLKQLLPIDADENIRLYHTHTDENPNVQLHMGTKDHLNDGDKSNDPARFVVRIQTGPLPHQTEQVYAYNNYSDEVEGEEFINMEDEFNHTTLVNLVMRRVNEQLLAFMPKDDDVDVDRWKPYHNETANHIQDDWERDPENPYQFKKVGSQHTSSASYR